MIEQTWAGGAPAKLVALDMDGTLLGTDGRVSARAVEAIFAAERAGVEVLIATGRRHSYAMRQLRGLGLRGEMAVISSNGAVTRTLASDLVARHHVGRATSEWLCGHLGEFRRSLVMTFDTVQPDGEDTRGALVVEHLDELHGSIGRWMEANESYLAHVEPIERALDAGLPIQMMLCGTVERMRQAERRLAADPRVLGIEWTGPVPAGAELALHRTEYPERDLSILDILPAGCSKGAAITALAESRGYDLSEVVAVGDNWNDLPMLERAGRAVLMGNAPAELHRMAAERAWHVAARNDEDGVAVFLEGLAAGVMPWAEMETVALR